MSMKLIVPAAVVVLGSAAAVLVATAKPDPQPQQAPVVPAPQVETVEVLPGTVTLSVQAQGSLRPRREVDLVAQVAGVVNTVGPSFRPGGRFSAGELLLGIDPRDYEIAVVRAQAAVADAREALAVERGRAQTAKSEWRDLGSAQANDLFLRRPQVASAEARLAAAQADLRKAELDLERARIVAPFVGRISALRADLGQYVTAGTPVATVYDTGAIEVALPLTGRQLAALGVVPGVPPADGLALPVTVHGRVGEQPVQWAGVIRRTAAGFDPQTRMLDLIAELEPDGEVSPLMIGQFVSAEITGRSVAGALQLPASALRARDEIWIVDEAARLRVVAVDVLQHDGDRVVVTADRGGPLQVVTSYLAGARDGMAVVARRTAEVASGVRP